MKATIRKLKQMRYKCPLPRKSQRVVHCKERNGKLKKYTEEEIFLHKCKIFAKIIRSIS